MSNLVTSFLLVVVFPVCFYAFLYRMTYLWLRKTLYDAMQALFCFVLESCLALRFHFGVRGWVDVGGQDGGFGTIDANLGAAHQQ